jgi:TonB-dependent starch-binding outer membrane protein SusC
MPTKFKLLAGLNTALLLFLSLSLFAQTSITGRVLSSADKQPVVGATVQVKGGKSATLTGSDGTFTINSSQKVGSLVITIVGYEPMTVPVKGSSIGDVMLSTSTTSLNDVVVTGYTTQKKKDLTGAVAVVNVKDMKSIQAGSPEQMLQGQASGVTVITSGAPGGPTNVFVRGVTSFGNTDPLYIIDGVPLDYHNINANDIESVQILKDASASIYGVRGSNGVVIVTTKRGHSSGGRPTVTYDGYIGTQQPLGGNPFHLLNSQQLANALWQADITSKQVDTLTGFPTSQQYGKGATPVLPDYITPGGAKAGSPAVNPLLYNVDYNKGPIYQITAANKQGTDWFHELFKPAPIQSHTLGMSGGSDKSSYYFSLGYFNQQGTLIDTYLKRYMARMNTTFAVKDNIRIGENFYAFYLNNPQISYFGENQINYDYREQPIIPVHDSQGNWAGSNGPELGNSSNPVANQERTAGNRGNQWQIMGNAWAEVDFLKHFTIRTSIGGTVINNYSYAYTYHQYENAENNGSNGFQENASYANYWDWINTLTYSNTWGKHTLKAFVGSEAINQNGRGIVGNRINYFSDNPNLWTLSNGDPKGQTNGSGAGAASLYSLFAQANYAYNERYLLTATIRRDGASVFGSDEQYGYFPAFSVGWILTQEDFMSSLTWLNFLKVRGSWGKLGSYNNTPALNQFTLFGASAGNSYYDIGGTSNSTVLGFYPTQFGSPKTGWENDDITDVGLDAVLIKNKIEFSLDWYEKKISGLLFQDNAAATSGAFPSSAGTNATQLPFVNIGDVQNNGIDMSLTYHATLSPVSKLNVTGIFTTYTSKVVSIPNAGGYFTSGGSRIGDFVRNQVGHPVGAFYGYEVIGYFASADDVTKSPTQQDAAPGRFKYADLNHDGKIDDKDRGFFGNPNPKFTYGINLNATFKNFDATVLFYGSYGNEVINYTRYWTDMWASFQGNKSINLLYNSWTPSNLNPKAPILENASTFSTNTVPNSFYKESGSFFKCRSLIFGYNLPANPLKSVGIDKFRVYVQGSNLFQITKYTGLDPEIGGSSSAYGIDYGQYPNNQKSYSVGISLTF